jgi:hypothetical protein
LADRGRNAAIIAASIETRMGKRLPAPTRNRFPIAAKTISYTLNTPSGSISAKQQAIAAATALDSDVAHEKPRR